MQLVNDKQTLTVDFWTNSGNVRHFFGFFLRAATMQINLSKRERSFSLAVMTFFSLSQAVVSLLYIRICQRYLQDSRLPSEWKFSGKVSGNVQWRCPNALNFRVETQTISKLNGLMAICCDRRSISELNWNIIRWNHFRRHKNENVARRCNIHIKWNYVGSMNLVFRSNSPAAHGRRHRRMKEKK